MRHSIGRRKNRSWTYEEKREICQQTAVVVASFAQVARRYAVNANLIFKWLNDPLDYDFSIFVKIEDLAE
jgi:transposase